MRCGEGRKLGRRSPNALEVKLGEESRKEPVRCADASVRLGDHAEAASRRCGG